MADGTATISPAKVWFKTLGENMLDVVSFTVHDQMSALFEVQLTASASDGTVDLSQLVGSGAALRFTHHTGDLVWAGICAEAAQIHNQPHGAAKSSVYRFSIVPALFRTTLRRNCRVFERMTLPQIVGQILEDWKIPCNMDKLKETYRKQDHRVQYNETDFAFITRLLEEAGISYYYDTGVKSGPGSSVTSVIFADAPQTEVPLQGAFPYHETGRHKTFKDSDKAVWNVSFGQRMTFGKVTIADYEMRQVLGSKLVASVGVADDKQHVYEDYQYVPGSFLAVEEGVEEPVADDRGKVRPVQGEAEDRVKRELGLLRHAQLRVDFRCSGVDLAPGMVFAIGQNSGDHHPNPELAPDKKLLIVRRHFHGKTSGVEHTNISAVSADRPHRPARRVPKSKVLGLQSALVVGPKKQEIYADEFGRVRVQFHWDREGVYDDESSCWMRVSQGWAGSGFGTIALPRVGQEVLVSFYEGDPDQPVVVGRLFNQTNQVPYPLPDNKTKSGWRTESSGGDQSSTARGYNELMFEDKLGHEVLSMRAERNLSTLVKASESGDIGKARSATIGSTDSVHIGPPGKDVQIYQRFVGKQTGLQMRSDNEIVLSTTKASIAMKDDGLSIQASEAGIFRAGKKFHVSAGPGAVVFMWGGPQVSINPPGAGDITPDPAALGKAGKPGGGPPIGPPFYPVGGPVAPPPPLGFKDVQVKNPPPSASETAASASAATAAAKGAATRALTASRETTIAANSETTPAAVDAASLRANPGLSNPALRAQESALRHAYDLSGPLATDKMTVVPDAQVERGFVKSELADNPRLDASSLRAMASKVEGFTSVADGITTLKSSATPLTAMKALVSSYASPDFKKAFGAEATNAVSQQIASSMLDQGLPKPAPAMADAFFKGKTDALGPTPSFTPPRIDGGR